MIPPAHILLRSTNDGSALVTVVLFNSHGSFLMCICPTILTHCKPSFVPFIVAQMSFTALPPSSSRTTSILKYESSDFISLFFKKTGFFLSMLFPL